MRYTAQTQRVKLDGTTPDAALIAQAAQVIRRGGLVAFPTETVYGLGANALDAAAVERIFSAKNRPASDPVIVHIHELGQLAEITVAVPPAVQTLAAAFWPGPLTLVLQRHASIPANVAAGGATVAVRMPQHPVALALLKAAQVPIAAPSANLFSRPSATSAQHVLDDLDGHVDLILDAGPTRIGVESTVLDLTSAVPQVLRPGGVALEDLRNHLPNIEVQARYLTLNDTAGTSPGMLIKHYSPRAQVIVLSGSKDAMVQEIHARTMAHIAQNEKVGIMLPAELYTRCADLPAERINLGDSADEISHNLFQRMRELDALGVDVILTSAPEQHGLGTAIWDRLLRAAEGHIVYLDDTDMKHKG